MSTCRKNSVPGKRASSHVIFDSSHFSTWIKKVGRGALENALNGLFVASSQKRTFSIRHATFSFILSKWLLPSAAATLHIWKSCFEAIKTYFKKWLTYHIDYFMLTFMWHLAVQQMHEEGLLSSMLLCTTVRFFNHTCFKTFNFLHSMNFAQRHWNDFAEKLQKSPHHHNCIASQKSQSSFCNDFLGIHSLLLWLVYMQGFIVTIFIIGGVRLEIQKVPCS